MTSKIFFQCQKLSSLAAQSIRLGEQGSGEQGRIAKWLPTRMPTLKATCRCLDEEALTCAICILVLCSAKTNVADKREMRVKEPWGNSEEVHHCEALPGLFACTYFKTE